MSSDMDYAVEAKERGSFTEFEWHCAPPDVESIRQISQASFYQMKELNSYS